MELKADTHAFQLLLDNQFDIFDWHPYFQSCMRYFLDHAQYDAPIQALAAFVNIQLPFQKMPHPVLSSQPTGSSLGGLGPNMLGASVCVPSKAATQRLVVPDSHRSAATGLRRARAVHPTLGRDRV